MFARAFQHAHFFAGLAPGVRDTADLTAMEFPVWSKAVSSQGTVKATPGWVNTPIVCAGASVQAGDVIVADADGVVVIPRADATAVAKAAQDRGMDVGRLRDVAKGRVWTGADARRHGLVDELGGLEDAVDLACTRAGIRRQRSLYRGEYSTNGRRQSKRSLPLTHGRGSGRENPPRDGRS